MVGITPIRKIRIVRVIFPLTLGDQEYSSHLYKIIHDEILAEGILSGELMSAAANATPCGSVTEHATKSATTGPAATTVATATRGGVGRRRSPPVGAGCLAVLFESLQTRAVLRDMRTLHTCDGELRSRQFDTIENDMTHVTQIASWHSVAENGTC